MPVLYSTFERSLLFYERDEPNVVRGVLVRVGDTFVDLTHEDGDPESVAKVTITTRPATDTVVLKLASKDASAFVNQMLIDLKHEAPTPARGPVFVNLTPHVLNMVDVGDIAPSGVVARISEIREPNEDGVTTISLGQMAGLPVALPAVFYVVARPLAVAMALAGQSRPDVVVVDRLVRDDKGVIIGAEGFARIV
jgi:hypothetical protein